MTPDLTFPFTFLCSVCQFCFSREARFRRTVYFVRGNKHYTNARDKKEKTFTERLEFLFLPKMK